MTLKVRVLAITRPPDIGRPQSTTYRAEAYDDADTFREKVWTCDHEHESVEAALQCGTEWLAQHGQGEGQGKGEETAPT